MWLAYSHNLNIKLVDIRYSNVKISESDIQIEDKNKFFN